MGMNMVTKGVHNVIEFLTYDFPYMDVIGISGWDSERRNTVFVLIDLLKPAMRSKNEHGVDGDELNESSDDSGMRSFGLRVISNVSNCSLLVL
ncbi:hypothetical protein F2Q70_00038251 [Brassica cretica]|uniref:Uncharacterized protein n=1 Tax=Brassica cretica TaxID=69181 RepID=A0A8S9K2F8_BRACR|nr:hypothetical protein F2Q70_00038251 [Brassica cretica]